MTPRQAAQEMREKAAQRIELGFCGTTHAEHAAAIRALPLPDEPANPAPIEVTEKMVQAAMDAERNNFGEHTLHGLMKLSIEAALAARGMPPALEGK